MAVKMEMLKSFNFLIPERIGGVSRNINSEAEMMDSQLKEVKEADQIQ